MSGKIWMSVILLIENEETDVFMFRRALSLLDFKGTLRVAGSVSAARDYFNGRGLYRDRNYYPIPALIVSDMSLPGEVGNEFLAWLRTQKQFSQIPFVFLSGTFLPREIARAGKLGVTEYVNKSGDIGELAKR